MGNDDSYPEEAPAVSATVDGFWLDATEVSVEQFSTFVNETGYVTVAEQPVDASFLPGLDVEAHPEMAYMLEPGGAVFNPGPGATARNLNWWTYVPGANWRHPQGPDRPAAAPDEPATQIAFEDAVAYAKWVGGRLPTEAEWEFATLAGDSNADMNQPQQANTWQGIFPIADTGSDGYQGVAPVGCYAANPNGLHDMLGNVWEWTADTYAPHHHNEADHPLTTDLSAGTVDGRSSVTTHVIKGGSFLCAANYCHRYRAAARQPQETGLGTNHIGFRIAYDRTNHRKDERNN